jgi:hypothetical protein
MIEDVSLTVSPAWTLNSEGSNSAKAARAATVLNMIIRDFINSQAKPRDAAKPGGD